MGVFEIGDTVQSRLEIFNKEKNGDYFCPGTSTKIKITDENGSIHVNNASMTLENAGRYLHDFDSTGKLAGKYAILFEANHLGGKTYGKDGFYLE